MSAAIVKQDPSGQETQSARSMVSCSNAISSFTWKHGVIEKSVSLRVLGLRPHAGNLVCEIYSSFMRVMGSNVFH